LYSNTVFVESRERELKGEAAAVLFPLPVRKEAHADPLFLVISPAGSLNSLNQVKENRTRREGILLHI
jgi:hypothetical protein